MTALSIEVAGLVAVTLAVAAVVSRSRATSGTLPAAGAALGVPAGVLTWAPLRHALFPRYEPGIDPAWLAAHQRWLAVAVAAAAVLAWALRDPARRALPRRPSRHRPAHDTGAHR